MSKPYELYLGLSELNISNSDVEIEIPILNGLKLDKGKVFYLKTNSTGQIEYEVVNDPEDYVLDVKGEQGPPGGSLSRKTLLLGERPYVGTVLGSDPLGYGNSYEEYYITDLLNSINGFSTETYPGGLRLACYSDTLKRLVFPYFSNSLERYKGVTIEVISFYGLVNIAGELNAPLLYYDPNYLIDDPLTDLINSVPKTGINGDLTNYPCVNHTLRPYVSTSIKLTHYEEGWLITVPKEFFAPPEAEINDPVELYNYQSVSTEV